MTPPLGRPNTEYLGQNRKEESILGAAMVIPKEDMDEKRRRRVEELEMRLYRLRSGLNEFAKTKK